MVEEWPSIIQAASTVVLCILTWRYVKSTAVMAAAMKGQSDVAVKHLDAATQQMLATLASLRLMLQATQPSWSCLGVSPHKDRPAIRLRNEGASIARSTNVWLSPRSPNWLRAEPDHDVNVASKSDLEVAFSRRSENLPDSETFTGTLEVQCVGIRENPYGYSLPIRLCLEDAPGHPLKVEVTGGATHNHGGAPD